MMARHRALLVLLVGCVTFTGSSTSALGKKPTANKCKRGTVPVSVQGRTLCQKVRSALPRPQKGDPRLAFFQAALGRNPGAVRDRHGHRLQSFSKLAGGRPYRAIARNLPGALAHLDKLATPRGGRAFARGASVGCKSGLPETSATYNGSDGTSVGVKTNSDGSASAQISTSAGNGLTVSVEFDMSQCNYFKVPPCPTADGRLSGTDRHPLHVRILVSDAAGTVRSESITTNSSEVLHGEVADDAKLDELVINEDSSFSFVFSGSQIGHVISERASISRQAIINMRFGYPAAFDGAVLVSGSVDGMSLSRADLAAEELRAKANFDKEFAKIVKQEVDRYRNLETGFDTPNTCVQVAFSPKSNSKTVSAGSSGSFQSQLEMNSGSGSPVGRWTLASLRGASFSPKTARGQRATFRYSVPSKTSATQIVASLKTTSKAGVAAGDWTQRLNTGDLYFRIVGYTRSEQSNTDRGQMILTNTLFGGPGPVTTVPPCTDPATCGAFVLEAKVSTTESGHVTGTPNAFDCPGGEFTYPPTTIQQSIRQPIVFDPAGIAPARASAGTVPSVGDVINDNCGASDSGEAQALAVSVPADALLSGKPVTFTFSGSGTVPSQGDHPGTPITWMLSESLTVQRVEADGSPLTAAA